MLMRVSVAVPRPLAGSFDYLCHEPVAVGARVRGPFGRGQVIGVVVAVAPDALDDGTLKTVARVLDDAPLLDAPLLQLLHFAARYYQHPLGEVVQAALPKLLREGRAATRDLPRYWRITAAGRAALAGRLGGKQAAVLSALHENEIDEATLLDGVTGSGKTEIYIRWIEHLTADGGQVLLLVPEIGLVRTLAARLAARLGDRIAVHHSALADGARLEQWLAVRAGDAQVLVGTRSAVFAPCPALRGIIIDEEHDAAYKQQDGFRYHARDLALKRAQQAGIPILLGSATPSLESYHQVWRGHWQHLRLTARAATTTPPAIHLENMDGAAASGGMSHELIRAMRRTLADGGQTLLFLNRRGYAPLLRCDACDWHAACDACDAMLTVHTASHRLQCHHCGRQQALPTRCPACHSDALHMLGLGTQRLEQSVARQFPQARILRIDSDAYSTSRQFEAALAQVQAGAVDIILGTQWLSKGHHFPRLHLVAVVDADQALYSLDYRGEERLAQLLVQVGGRAGRESQGQIWIQTRQPQHPVFTVLNAPYEDTARRLYEQRAQTELPPHRAQVALLARHTDAERALQTLAFTRDGAQQAGIGQNWQWLGPAPAVMPRKDGQHRAHLLIQADSRAALQKELPQLTAWLHAQGKAFRVRVAVDVDPLWLE